MSEREQLIAAVLAEPEEDLPRLVFADWLEENGEPERAGFIRREVKRGDDGGRPCVLPWFSRGGGGRWYWGADGNTRLWRKGEIKTVCDTLPEPEHADWTAGFSRGFVSEVGCLASDWLRYAGNLFARHPLTRVVLLDKEPFDFEGRYLWTAAPTEPRVAYRWELPRGVWCREIGEWYESRWAAVGALSNRLVAIGRSLAGLPPLRVPEGTECPA